MPSPTLKLKKIFTIVELLVVIGIIAMLIAISVPGLTGADRQSRDKKSRSIIAQIEIAQESYKARTGYYLPQYLNLHNSAYSNHFFLDDNDYFVSFLPSYGSLKSENMKEEKVRLNSSSGSSVNKKVLIDSYGNPFIYRNPGQKNTTKFDLYSEGKDPNDNKDDVWNF